MLSMQKREFRETIRNILNKAETSRDLTNQEIMLLFHFVKHQNEPMYKFVSERYKYKRF